MFACIGTTADGVSVKTPGIETAQMPIDAGLAQGAPYCHRGRVRLPPDGAPEELRHRIRTAHDLIRGKLPRKLRTALAPRRD